MAYEVTATRRRPGQFDDLVGQEFVVSTIENSIKAERIAHAYLFSGPRGVGKTSAARILARAVNCQEGPTATPCGVCSACSEITKGNALDVIEIDGASNTSVNDIREIKDEVLFAPNSCRYKVYIIDEVHMLSNSAFNALLKTIEEPPPYIIFIFATTEIHKVPATIRSRCQQFNFRLISLEQIKESLGGACGDLGIEAEDDALFWIAKEATGSMRDAYTLFDQVAAFSDGRITLEKIREKLGLVGLDSMNEIVQAMVERNSPKVIDLSSSILGGGVSIEQFAADLAEYFRSLLFISCGIDKESLLGYARARYSQLCVTAYTKPQLERALELIFNFYRDVRYSINPRFELELLLSHLSDLKAWCSPVEITDRLESLKAAVASGEIAAVPPSPPSQPAPGGKGSAGASDAAVSAEPVEPVQSTQPVAPVQQQMPPQREAQPFVQPEASAAAPAGTATATMEPPAPVPAQAPVSEPPYVQPAETVRPSEPQEPQAAPVAPAAPADSAQQGAGGQIVPAQKEQILDAIRRRKLTLAAAVEHAVKWSLISDVLTFTFENGYTATVVRNDRALIHDAIMTVTGDDYRIEVEVVQIKAAHEDGGEDDSFVKTADAVKKVFRGEVVG